MSSRQLRKLQKQRELEALEAQAVKEQEEAEDSSEDEAPVIRGKPSTFSGFAALGGDDNDDDDDDDHNDEDDDGDNEDAKQDTPDVKETSKPVLSRKSKKKKKKGGKKGSPSTTAPVAQSAGEKDGRTATVATKDEDDEIDRAIRELRLADSKTASAPGKITDGGAGSPEARAYERICDLLQVNTHHLKVMSEMRRMFGRDAITTVQREEAEEQAAAARNRQQRRGATQEVDLETYLKGVQGHSLPEVTLRRNPFLDGKESWPKAPADGLTMEEVRRSELPGCGKDSLTVEFRLVHDPAYNEKEKSFFSLVQMFDPMQLVHFLHRNPYHVSTLIQVTKVAKQDQNLALAADLCERALFTFGRISISLFRKKIQEGRARLDFRRPENRQFWLAGYHYLSSLMHKGTYRTALEWSKLLYALDPSDPYGLVHFIHISALKSHESSWFIDFCDSEALDRCETAQDYVRQSLVLARLQQGDKEGARTLLVEGMERLPWLYSTLCKAIGLDVPKTIWGFTPRDGHEELYVELYVHQTKKLWDNSQATSLLKEAAALASKPDESTFAPLPVVGRNLARFIYLDDTPALMGLVPGGMLSTSPNWEFDPLPPFITENIFSYDSQRQPWQPTGPANLTNISPARARQLQRIIERMQRAGGNNEELMAMAQELQAAQRGEGGDEDDGWSDSDSERGRADRDAADLDELAAAGIGRDGAGEEEGGDGLPRAPGTAPRLFNGALQAVLNAMGIGGTGGGLPPQENQQGQTQGEPAERQIPGAYVEDYDDSEDEALRQNAGRH